MMAATPTTCVDGHPFSHFNPADGRPLCTQDHVIPATPIHAARQQVNGTAPASAPSASPDGQMGLLKGRAAPPERSWPEPPGVAAFRGLAGRVIDTIDAHTEADRVAVLGSFLVAFGNAVGAGPHMLV